MSRWTRFVVCVLVCAVFVLPLVAMVVVAFTPRELIFDGGAGLWPDRWTTANFTGLTDDLPGVALVRQRARRGDADHAAGGRGQPGGGLRPGQAALPRPWPRLRASC